jgi:hypothetical protein
MARGNSRAQSELRSAGPESGPNKGLDKEQVEAFRTLMDKQGQDGWIGTDIPVNKLNPDERADFMAHLEAEDERFMDTYDSTLDENGEQTDDDFDRQQSLRAEAEQGAVQRFFEGQTKYNNFGKLGEPGKRASADQKIVQSAIKQSKLKGNDLEQYRLKEKVAFAVNFVNDRMDSITVAEYTRISDAGTVDLMKHDTYDKWMRSSTGGKEFMKEVKETAALSTFKEVLRGKGNTFYAEGEKASYRLGQILDAADKYEQRNR